MVATTESNSSSTLSQLCSVTAVIAYELLTLVIVCGNFSNITIRFPAAKLITSTGLAKINDQET